MSASKLAEDGMKAAHERDWDEAIKKLSKAIDQSKSPAWLLARSQAYMETGVLDKALRDAEYAYCSAKERGNDKSRKQMIEAQYRRSVIYFRKKRYADADVCAVVSQRLAEGVSGKEAEKMVQERIDAADFYHATVAEAIAQQNERNNQQGDDDQVARLSKLMGGSKSPYEKDWNKAQVWRCQILGFLEGLPADDPARKVTVKLVPVKPSLEDKDLDEVTPDPDIEAAKASFIQPRPKAVDGPVEFRSDFYQSDGSITVTLFMKFAGGDDVAKVQVDIQSNLITITGVPREPSTAYIVPHAAIDPTKSKYRVAQMKIEFTLAKLQAGKWPGFGREELSQPDVSTLPETSAVAAPAATPPGSTPTPATAPTTEKGKAPAYPTSSKSGPKDWDNVITIEDDEAPQDVTLFFKQLYKNATPEQQRAMMKSYVESSGTALSTDWDTVSKGTVPVDPPVGIEAKKWES